MLNTFYRLIFNERGDFSIGGLGDIVSSTLGFIGQQQTNSANAAIASQTNATASADTAATNAANLAIAKQNDDMQEQFAQQGIQWKVADAAKAGISPLAALGAAEPSASPAVAIMQSPPLVSPTYDSPLKAIAAGFHDGSQNVSRSLSAMKSPEEKASDALDLVYKSKQNDLLDVQIKNAQLELARKSAPPGIPDAFGYQRNADGTVSMVPSADAAQSSHGEFLGPIQWSLRNKLLPWFEQGAMDVDTQPYKLAQ